MKNLMLVGLVSFLAQSAMAETIKSLPEAEAMIDASSIAKISTLVFNAEKDLTWRFITLDKGTSTDFTPRFQFLITMYHPGEEAETRTVIQLGEGYSQAEIKKVSPGIFNVTYAIYVNDEHKMVTRTVDLRQAFKDDREFKFPELGSFRNYVNTSITVTDSK